MIQGEVLTTCLRLCREGQLTDGGASPSPDSNGHKVYKEVRGGHTTTEVVERGECRSRKRSLTPRRRRDPPTLSGRTPS